MHTLFADAEINVSKFYENRMINNTELHRYYCTAWITDCSLEIKAVISVQPAYNKHNELQQTGCPCG